MNHEVAFPKIPILALVGDLTCIYDVWDVNLYNLIHYKNFFERDKNLRAQTLKNWLRLREKEEKIRGSRKLEKQVLKHLLLGVLRKIGCWNFIGSNSGFNP